MRISILICYLVIYQIEYDEISITADGEEEEALSVKSKQKKTGKSIARIMNVL